MPVGTGVQPGADTLVLAAYLLTGGDERVAARKVDDFIRRLPGFENVRLLEAWGRRAAAPELRRGRLLASRPLSRS